MAGIGFELKKIFRKNNISRFISGYFYAAFASIGPTLVMFAFLLGAHFTMRRYGVNYMTRSAFSASVMYSFIISLVSSSLITNVLSRYLADTLYKKQFDKILAACYGSVFLGAVISGSFGLIFYLIAKLNIYFEFLSYALIVQLTILFILMVFVSALREYKIITFSFMIAAVIGLIIMYFMLIYGMDVEIAGMFAFNIYFLITIILLMINISRTFQHNDGSYFYFIKYYKEVKELAISSMFYSITLFIHNIIIWFSPIGVLVANTYICAPSYDMASFFAMLTILPSTVLFVVNAETNFYDKYVEYVNILSGAGTLRELEDSRVELKNILYFELAFIVEMQFMITIISMFLARYLFPYFGISSEIYGYFGFLAIGYLCLIMVNLVTVFMFYFDARNEVAKIMSFLLVSNILCTYVTLLLGQKFYGMGTLVASFLSFIYALLTLRKIMINLNYRLYCSNPINIE